MLLCGNYFFLEEGAVIPAKAGYGVIGFPNAK